MLPHTWQNQQYWEVQQYFQTKLNNDFLSTGRVLGSQSVKLLVKEPIHTRTAHYKRIVRKHWFYATHHRRRRAWRGRYLAQTCAICRGRVWKRPCDDTVFDVLLLVLATECSPPLPPLFFFFLRRRRFREGLQWRSITLCEVEIKEEGYTMKLRVKGMITGRAKSGWAFLCSNILEEGARM